MKFLFEWLENAPNRAPEEAATLCSLAISIGGQNACRHWDEPGRRFYDRIIIPAGHLAGGIAADWRRITGGRNEQRSTLPYRAGFILSDIVFKHDGRNFTTAIRKIRYQNPPLDFQREGSETVPCAEAERELAAFIDAVNERLTGKDVRNTELRRQLRRVKRSRQNPEVSEFCEAADALGLDPYEI